MQSIVNVAVRILHENQLLQRRQCIHLFEKYLKPPTHLVFLGGGSTEKSFRRIKLLNEPLDTSQAVPHGQRHLAQ